MQTCRWLLSVLLTILITALAGHLSAATFIVPSDDELVRKSKAIVVATVDSVATQATPEGGIETSVTLTIEESIKGSLAAQGRFSVAEPGGVLGTRALVVPGSPQFNVGDRLLLFLDRDKHGQWTTQDLVVGKFKFERDNAGRNILAREAAELQGWDQNGDVHQEKARAAAAFLDFVRNRAHGKPADANYVVQSASTDTTTSTITAGTSAVSAYAPSSYLSTITMSGVTQGVRWPGFGSAKVFYNRNTQPGAPSGGVPAIQAGLGAWTNDCGSVVSYAYGGQNPSAQGNNSMDGINGVVFEDVFGEIPGSFTGSGTLAVGSYWVNGTTNSIAGEMLYSIVEGNVVVQDNLEIWSGTSDQRFNQLLAHELGHTLGFRHSDESGRTPNTTAAIMRASLVTSYGANLQQYDIDAVRTVYPGGTCAGGTLALSSISPSSGAAGGGTVITINGSNFVSGATVTFGAKSATSVTFVSSSQIRAAAPAFVAGTSATVTVRNPDASTASLANAYFADFADVPPSSSYHNSVVIVYRNGVMTGCGSPNFCPGYTIPRRDMAMFVLKGKHGSAWTPPPATGIFTDVSSSDPWARWIEAAYNEGITTGCSSNPLKFCPTGTITRGQMAIFLLRAEHGAAYTAPTPTGIFADMPTSSGYTRWAEQLYREGVTAGCTSSPLQYCPGSTVTRGQMAAFLVTTFNLH